MKLETIGIKKIGADAGFLLVASLSSLLAASVIATGPIYFDAVERLGVERMVSNFGDSDSGAWAHVTEVTFNPAAIASVTEALDSAGDELGYVSRGRALFLRSGSLDVSGINDGPAPPALDLHYQSVDGIEPDVELVSGRLPSSGSVGGEIEVALVDDVAGGLDIGVGDRLTLLVPPTDIVHSIARVVGRFSIRDASDESWLGLSSSLFDPEQGPTGGRPAIMAYAADASLSRVARRGIADQGEVWALYYTDEAGLLEHGIDETLSLVAGFREHVSREVSGARSFSGLQSAYLRLQRQLMFANTTTLIVGSLFVAFALLGMGVHAWVLSRTWVRESALLHARGSGKVQLWRALLTYGLFLFAVPTLLGPLIASGVLPQLGRMSAFSDLTGGDLLPSGVVFDQFLWSGIASLVALGVYVLPLAYPRRDHLTRYLRRGGGTGSPWFWRVKLDFAVMIAAAAIVVELDGRGSLFVEGSDGGTGLSVLAASLPVVAWLGAGLLSLRLLRLLGVFLERLARVNFHAMFSLGLRLFSRSAMDHAVLLLLSAGTVVVSVNAVGLANTLERNVDDRERFMTAADVRVSGMDGVGGSNNEVVREVVSQEWVDGYAWGARSVASAGVTESSSSFDLLSVQPRNFGEIAWFRDDFADESLGSLMGSLEDYGSPQPLPLPSGSVGLAVSASLEHSGKGRVDLWARVIDGGGGTHTLRLAPLDGERSGDWQEWAVDVPARVERPVSLIGFQVYEPPTAPLGDDAVLSVDSVRAVMSDGVEVVVSEFDDDRRWHGLEGSLPNNVEVRRVSEGADWSSDGVSIQVTMGRGTTDGIRGIYHSSDDATVAPLVVSAGFLDATGLAVGDYFAGRVYGHIVPFVIRGEFDLFPTMDSEDALFGVSNVDALVWYLRLVSEPFLSNTAELFLDVSVDEGSSLDRRGFVKSLSPSARYLDREELSTDSSTALATTAGWRVIGSVVWISAVTLGSVAAVAFVIHRQSVSRVDNAVLEAMGAGRLGIMFEGLLRVSVALALGAALGVASGLLGAGFIADRMTRAETGDAALPPMVLSVDWWLIIFGVAVVALSALLPIVWVSWRAGASVAMRLRIGDGVR